MKLLIMSIVLSVTAMATERIDLEAGESIYIDNKKIVCNEGDPTVGSIGEAYALLPNSHQVRILKEIGIGSCYIKELSGGFSFLYTDRYVNGIHLSSSHGYLIDNALINGDCGI